MLSTLALPAAARDSYVQDGAGMFASGTVSSLNQTIGDFNRQTGKEVVVKILKEEFLADREHGIQTILQRQCYEQKP